MKKFDFYKEGSVQAYCEGYCSMFIEHNPEEEEKQDIYLVNAVEACDKVVLENPGLEYEEIKALVLDALRASFRNTHSELELATNFIIPVQGYDEDKNKVTNKVLYGAKKVSKSTHSNIAW